MKSLILPGFALLALMLVFAPGRAGAADIGPGSEQFVQKMAGQALDFLGDPNLTKAQRRAEFSKLLQTSFDMKTIGRFVLGRYWRQATPQQRDEYQRLFEKKIIDVYSNRFDEYKGQKFQTKGYIADENGIDTLVNSLILQPQGTAPVKVDWRVRYKDGRYRIVDVIVEGVSMSVTQRSEYAAVIQRGGGDVQVLIAHLKGQ